MNTANKGAASKARNSAQKKRHAQRRQQNHSGKRPLDFTGMDDWNATKLSWRFPRGYYEDKPFICRDCGQPQIWTAAQQKWWYEEMRGDPDSIAVRCRACRIRKREIKAEARRVSEEGMARKRARLAQINKN